VGIESINRNRHASEQKGAEFLDGIPTRGNGGDQPATHSQLAASYIKSLTLAHGTAPIYDEGSLWVCEASVWHEYPFDFMEVEIGTKFSHERTCRRGSDYSQIARHAAKTVAAPDFFVRASPGIATCGTFYRVTTEGLQREPLSPSHQQRYVLPVEPDWTSARPLFDMFLKRTFTGDDAERQMMVLQEVTGGAVAGFLHLLHQAVLFFGGESTGKSTCQNIIGGLVPAQFVTSTSPHRWSNDYFLAVLAGKRLNLVGELSKKEAVPTHVFKNVLGGDRIQGRHPTHRPFNFICTAAHFFNSNFLPNTPDRSNAFFRRWRVIVFDNLLTPEEVELGFDQVVLAKELPQVLAWALDGAVRLLKHSAFTESASHTRMMRRWKATASPVLEFLLDEQWIELVADTSFELQGRVYRDYASWCKEVGHRPLGRNSFYEEMDALGGAVGVYRKRIPTAEVVVGVRLKSDPL
jgi:P4 family phage/plasmid primase-like protien